MSPIFIGCSNKEICSGVRCLSGLMISWGIARKTAYRKLLDIAGYEDLPIDFVIIHQNTTVDKLALISDGLAKIEVDGTIVSYVRNGQFVGEMSFLSGNLTTATVTTIDETRCLLWDKEQLRVLMKKNIEVEASMQMVFSSDLLSKMMGSKGA